MPFLFSRKGEKVVWTWEDAPTYGFDVGLPISDIYDKNNHPQMIDFFSYWLNEFVNIIKPRLKMLKNSNQ